jgi:2-iminobutanoate/2-iminopropanoate deaminase
MRRASFFMMPALAAFLLTAACEGPQANTDASGQDTAGPLKEAINPGGGEITTPFSPMVRSGNLIFMSGVIGRPGDGGAAQATRQAMDGVQSRLEAIDATMEDLVKCTVFMVDMDDYGAMNEVYAGYFEGDPPARSALAVRALPAQATIEVECIAAVP